MKYEIHVGACSWEIGNIRSGLTIALVEGNNDVTKDTPLFMVTDYLADHNQVFIVDIDTGCHMVVNKDTKVITMRQVKKTMFTTENMIPTSGDEI